MFRRGEWILPLNFTWYQWPLCIIKRNYNIRQSSRIDRHWWFEMKIQKKNQLAERFIIIIIIIIIKKCWQYGFFWLPLTICSYQLLLIPLNSTKCQYRADESKFLLVRQYWSVDVLESMGENFLKIHPSFLLKCPTCLACLIWMVCEMGGKWSYSCCFQDLFKTASSIIATFTYSFFSWHFVMVQVELRWQPLRWNFNHLKDNKNVMISEKSFMQFL